MKSLQTANNYVLPLFILLLIMISVEASAQDEVKLRSYSVEELKADFAALREAIVETHPALYVFTSKAEFDRLFEKQYALINRPMNRMGFYRLIAPLVARIGCGHTMIFTPGDFWQSSPDRIFPLELHLSGKRAFVLDSYGIADIPAGSELLSINGKPSADIITEMKNNTSADAFIDTYLSRHLEGRFSVYFALNYGFPKKYDFEYKMPSGDISLRKIFMQPRSRNDRKARTAKNQLDFEQMKERNVAVLTVRTFRPEENLEQYKTFIDNCFRQVSENRIRNLILDLRGNEGGDPYFPSYLARFLLPKSVPYFLEPYEGYEDLAEPVPIAEKNHFAGNMLVLIDGNCFSSTGHLASLMKFHKVGTFIGEEAGATYTCNDGGQTFLLENTGFQIYVAGHTYATAVSGLPWDRGILPDHAVLPSIQDLVSGKDAVMEFAFSLIK